MILAEMTDTKTDLRIRQKQTELLKTAVDICNKSGIDYCLIEETALAAYRDGQINDYPVMSVDIADAEKFIEASEKTEGGLKCDGVFNDPRHPVFSIDLYDPSTIDFSADSFFEKAHNCMRVTVRLQREADPSKPGRMLTSAAIRLMRSSAPAVMRNAAARQIMRDLGHVYGNPAGAVILGDLKYKKMLITDTVAIDIDGTRYKLPGDTDTYLKGLFGQAWQEHPLKRFEESKDRFRDIDHSWEEYSKLITGTDTGRYAALQKKYRPLNDRYIKAREAIESNFKLLERTHARIQLWKKYIERKAEILSLVEDDKMTEAEELLRGYFDQLSRFHDIGLGLCFDPEIFEAACTVLTSSGRGDYADELRALIPEEHKKPFVLYDYKGRDITDTFTS